MTNPTIQYGTQVQYGRYNVYSWECVVVRAAVAALQSTVICHREFLSQRKRILSYIPQLPFIVDKFADSTKKGPRNDGRSH